MLGLDPVTLEGLYSWIGPTPDELSLFQSNELIFNFAWIEGEVEPTAGSYF